MWHSLCIEATASPLSLEADVTICALANVLHDEKWDGKEWSSQDSSLQPLDTQARPP